ncbi:HET domain containing protein [Naviculisporaceae sp. PSN 640]
MRLLNTETLFLSEFYGAEIPPYAILSHRWGREEVTFADLTNGLASTRRGYAKLKGFCDLAAADGFEYCWIDTCCIDKSSSAELSEAINSMFARYQNSEVCIVFLEDVDSTLDPQSPATVPNSLRSSAWWARGWTLQELIAPLCVSFHGSDWGCIGTRTALQPVIHDITDIDPRCFGASDLSGFPVAQRMSWAAKRQTTRIEDEAYCLMGIFGINIPLLYGEGKHAFRRLQEEIIRRSTDDSIFATARSPNPTDNDWVLAPSPEYFVGMGHVRSLPPWRDWSYLLIHTSNEKSLVDHGATVTGLGISRPVLHPTNLSILDAISRISRLRY